MDLIWPAQCHICGQRPESENGYLCLRCLQLLPKVHFKDSGLNPMDIRFIRQVPFLRANAYLRYNTEGMMAPLVHDFKYHGFRRLARYMGNMAANDSGMRSHFSDVDALVPIPIFSLKKLKRGYNQTEEIAKGIGDVLNIEVVDNLHAGKPHRSQTRMTLEGRQENLKGVFHYHPRAELSGKHLMLVDDVCTTGATMLSAAKTILDADSTITVSFFALCVVCD